MAAHQNVEYCHKCGKPRLASEPICGNCGAPWKVTIVQDPYLIHPRPLIDPNAPLTPYVVRKTLFAIVCAFAFVFLTLYSLFERLAASSPTVQSYRLPPSPDRIREVRLGWERATVIDVLGQPDHTSESTGYAHQSETLYYGAWYIELERGKVFEVNKS